jgi:DNA-binding PadR family transcriptional regulator
MADRPSEWRYGYDLAAEVGLKSGSLYPLLMRLAEQGILSAAWEERPPPGRPARHLYRLTAHGVAYAAELRRRTTTVRVSSPRTTQAAT